MNKKSIKKEVKEKLSSTETHPFIIFELEKDDKGNLINVKVTRNEINLFEEIGLLENHLSSLKISPVLTKMFNTHLDEMEKEMNLLLQLSGTESEGLAKN